MATHGMHNTTLSKPLVVHRVAWVWTVHHQEDGMSNVLDESVEHHNGVGEVCGCHQTMVCWSSLWSSSLCNTIKQCMCTVVVCVD